MKRSRLGYAILAVCFMGLPVFAQGSAKVVKVNPGAPAYQIKRGGAAQIAVNIEVDEGYHINSNRPADKNLIATSLKLDRTAGLTATPVVSSSARSAASTWGRSSARTVPFSASMPVSTVSPLASAVASVSTRDRRAPMCSRSTPRRTE